MLKYVDRLRTQRERVEQLEGLALSTESAAIDARAKATLARAAYNKRVKELTPKDPDMRPTDLWPIGTPKPTKRTSGNSAKRAKEIAAEVARDIAKGK